MVSVQEVILHQRVQAWELGKSYNLISTTTTSRWGGGCLESFHMGMQVVLSYLEGLQITIIVLLKAAQSPLLYMVETYLHGRDEVA